MNSLKFALPVLFSSSSLFLISCNQSCPVPDYSGKCVVEPASYSTSYSDRSASSTSYNSNNASGTNYASASTPETSSSNFTAQAVPVSEPAQPVSDLKIVSQQEARSILQAQGVEYAGNAFQNDGIPVAFQEQKKVIVLNVADAHRTIDARGRDVVILGSTSKITIRDRVGKLIVSGERNVVNTQSARQMDVHGDGNHLTLGSLGGGAINGNSNRVDWTRSGQKPNISLNGSGNNIATSR